MRGILLFFVVVSTVYGAQETLSDLYELLKDPTLLAQIEKRLGADFDVDDDLFSDVDGCYDTSGMVNSECNFYANGSAIIKTAESIARGAEFLKEHVNITCPRDCTALCCDFTNCDTSVYQDKGDRKCYLFHCGDKSNCVFTYHEDYWTGSISKETHKSHSFAPGGATQSHENELENLGSHADEFPSTSSSTPPPTTVKTTTLTTTIASLPGLGKYCPSYGSKCEDPHAECLMKSCKCRVGYHEKHGICRKHCRNEEFECENYAYYSNVDSKECVPNEFVCDGNQDCIDASDESNCPDKSKQAYLDGDAGTSVYNSPFFNSQFNQQQDPQYQYGFPIPGLNSQQASGLLPPANPIYTGQVATNQNAAGQYYVPALTNQNQGNLNLANQGSPINQQWPLAGRIASQVPAYQNNVPVQYPARQQQYLGQPGYIQSPVQPVQPVGQNVHQTLQGLQQVQSNQVPNMVANQNPTVAKSRVTNAPVQHIPNINQASKLAKQTKDDSTGYAANHRDEAGAQQKDETNNFIPLNREEHVNTEIDDRYNEQTLDRQTPSSRNFDYHQTQVDTGKPNVDVDDLVNHRHSSEEKEEDVLDNQRTYPPATKTKTQIGSPTQSTVSGRKSSHTNSEGYADYPWMSYDSNSPRVSGKKGNTIDVGSTVNKNTDDGRRKKPGISDDEKSLDKPQTKDEDVEEVDNKPSKKPASNSHFDNQFDYNRYDGDNRFPDDYRNYDDYRRPANNPRPSYMDRFNNRHEGNRRRPSPGQGGSRYPYYPNSGYPRGRDKYPVWDPYKDEYYYPDNYEDRRDFNFKGKADDQEPPRKPVSDNAGNRNNPLGPHPDRVKPAVQKQTTVKHFVSSDLPTTPPTTAAPLHTEPTQTVKSTGSNIVTPDSQASANDDKDMKPVGNEEDSSSDNQSADTSESKNNNNTESIDEKTGSTNKFNILNAETVEVKSYTDSFQGPIVALALGLAITLILLIFVGCRLRTVKRRLRKGRALHSNEADYLINGMYL